MKKKETKAAKPAEPEVSLKKRVTIAQNVSCEMEERKSIFIGHAAPIRSEEEARMFIEAKRKEYHDATHNVYAYMLNGG
ncbi:MAG: YigZ family protein, partial [Clostridia bacterium]|nr:YigZ family protein [Clostridia bacterium]